MKTKFLLILKVLIIAFFTQNCCSPSKVVGSINNTLKPQETNNWCWAATTQMIAQNEGKSVSQCDLANHRFGKTNCCDFQNDGTSCPKTSDCNSPGWLELDYAGLKFSESETALSWSKLKKCIYCSKDVLGYAYGTPGVVGHVLVIKGYITVANTKYVVLNDPWAPCVGSERLITYDTYVDPPGNRTHWRTWYSISKK
ncbi:hypothetical protein A8C32_00355 [Flavivirga aquatica]|uniref:Peptidase C39-like domain-containing protein n=1 Tax=Flavivirga aquatica TaxID=1849968 RepID=A0A1E5TBL0_9FLAO|nr:papain-like cysteine protease family protein [Flavivirga aquatica]OEK08764.1 hypothetical protein A8C32_00355 [Flavivirga aquatica]